MIVPLIFICCVAAPIAWFGWLWFFEPRPLIVGIVSYGFVIIAILAFVWAADAPAEYALVALFLLLLAALRMHVRWFFRDYLRSRRR